MERFGTDTRLSIHVERFGTDTRLSSHVERFGTDTFILARKDILYTLTISGLIRALVILRIDFFLDSKDSLLNAVLWGVFFLLFLSVRLFHCCFVQIFVHVSIIADLCDTEIMLLNNALTCQNPSSSMF